MILDLFYISLVIFAIISIQTKTLRKAVIYLSVFSLLSSAAYLLLGAPDVAIAEAVIGCTLSTVLYLVALKKYHIFRVYYNVLSNNSDVDIDLYLQDVLSDFSKEHELQLDLIHTKSPYKNILSSFNSDIIIFEHSNHLELYGLKESYQYLALTKHLKQNLDIPITSNFIDESTDYEEVK